jgi:hypothetical protein
LEVLFCHSFDSWGGTGARRRLSWRLAISTS